MADQQLFRMEHFFVRQLVAGKDTAIETGGNIRLHQDWLEPVLQHFQGNSAAKPIIFRISCNNQSPVFCGVNSWHTYNDPDCGNRVVYLPKWMMVHLNFKTNDIVRLVPIQIPNGSYVKLRAFTALVTMEHQKEFLETQLKQFTCLTIGQELMFGDHSAFIVEVGIKKGIKSIYDTICIINTDLEVDFDEPIDYTPPPPSPPPPVLSGPRLVLGTTTTTTPEPVLSNPDPVKKKEFKPFGGQGYSLK